MVSTFVALGDSFTEGLNDPGPDGEYRGWADRFAEILAARNGGLRYANLAVRGKMLGEVVSAQLPVALAMAPDLVSIAAGGNDLLRPGADPDQLAELFEGAVTQLRDTGCQVLILTGFDPRTFPVIRWIRGRVAVYNMHLRAIADRQGCLVLDLWSMPILCDPRVWSDDRLHLAAEGHRRVALRACETLGLQPGPDLSDADWRTPLPALADVTGPAAGANGPGGVGGFGGTRGAWLAARRLDARWAREHAAP
jgi:lysophospholipase L1-like esterase